MCFDAKLPVHFQFFSFNHFTPEHFVPFASLFLWSESKNGKLFRKQYNTRLIKVNLYFMQTGRFRGLHYVSAIICVQDVYQA